MMEFEGKAALVTGAASGIGRACALEFARGGADVMLVDVAGEVALAQVENLLKAAGGRVVSFRADVSEHAEEIHSRLAEGTMPCDAPWPQEDVERFRAWIDAGLPA